VLGFLGFPIVFSLVKNCNRSKPSLDVSTYMDVTATHFSEGDLELDD